MRFLGQEQLPLKNDGYPVQVSTQRQTVVNKPAASFCITFAPASI